MAAKKRYRLMLAHTDDTWTEDYYLSNPEEAYQMIEKFNKFLRPGELSRILVDVTEVCEDDE